VNEIVLKEIFHVEMMKKTFIVIKLIKKIKFI